MFHVRRQLWLTHGCMGLYGDDGEMQCGMFPSIDFKRDSLEDIMRRIERHNQRRWELYQVSDEAKSNGRQHPRVQAYERSLAASPEQAKEETPPPFAGKSSCACGFVSTGIAIEGRRELIAHMDARHPGWRGPNIPPASSEVQPEQQEGTDELNEGTFKCDICGMDKPHSHEPQLVEMERLVRPAFEKTTVPRSAFARLDKSPGGGYLDRETQHLWQHFLSGWFAAKTMLTPAPQSAIPLPSAPTVTKGDE